MGEEGDEMDDMISRKAAIDASCTCHGGKHCNHYPCKDVQAIMDLPSVQPQRWIPCSETVDIPEYSVLACDKYGEYIIGFLCYEDDQWLCESEHEYMYDAVAWMPLPPSYKGGQE